MTARVKLSDFPLRFDGPPPARAALATFLLTAVDAGRFEDWDGVATGRTG
jgi:hypothetical protein